MAWANSKISTIKQQLDFKNTNLLNKSAYNNKTIQDSSSISFNENNVLFSMMLLLLLRIVVI